MADTKKWRALHAVDDHSYETVEVIEQSNGTYMYSVGGHSGTLRAPDAAMAAAEVMFSRLYPSHRCGRLCTKYVLREG
jgi:hypothetical protein